MPSMKKLSPSWVLMPTTRAQLTVSMFALGCGATTPGDTREDRGAVPGSVATGILEGLGFRVFTATRLPYSMTPLDPAGPLPGPKGSRVNKTHHIEEAIT